jgi:hypothetical protein
MRNLTWIALALLIGTPPAQAQPIAYVAGDLWTVSPTNLFSTRWLCTIDLATGELTPIARIIDPDSSVFLPVDGLDFDPLTGRLWAVNGFEELFELDPATGQVVGSIVDLTDSVTGLPLNSTNYALAFAPDGTLYISAGGSGPFFGIVDKATGVVVQLETGNDAARARGLAVAPGGAVFGTDVTTPADRVDLVEIDPSDGSFGTIGELGDPLNASIGLDFDASGELWGIERGSSESSIDNSRIFLVDTATAARTTVWTPTDPVTGLQIRAEALPEPGLGLSLAGGVALLAWLARRR